MNCSRWLKTGVLLLAVGLARPAAAELLIPIRDIGEINQVTQIGRDLWVAGNVGVRRVSPGIVAEILVWESGRSLEQARVVAETSLGIWAGTDQGIFRISGDVAYPVELTLEGLETLGQIKAIREGFGAIWLGTDQGLVRVLDGVAARIQSIPRAEVSSVEVWQERLLVGSKRGAFCIESPTTEAPTDIEARLLLARAIPRVVVAAGDAWFISLGETYGPCFRWRSFDLEGGPKKVRLARGGIVYDVLQAEGEAWLLTSVGLERFRALQSEPIGGTPEGVIQAAASYETELWLVVEGKLFRRSGGEYRPVPRGHVGGIRPKRMGKTPDFLWIDEGHEVLLLEEGAQLALDVSTFNFLGFRWNFGGWLEFEGRYDRSRWGRQLAEEPLFQCVAVPQRDELTRRAEALATGEEEQVYVDQCRELLTDNYYPTLHVHLNDKVGNQARRELSSVVMVSLPPALIKSILGIVGVLSFGLVLFACFPWLPSTFRLILMLPWGRASFLNLLMILSSWPAARNHMLRPYLKAMGKPGAEEVEGLEEVLSLAKPGARVLVITDQPVTKLCDALAARLAMSEGRSPRLLGKVPVQIYLAAGSEKDLDEFFEKTVLTRLDGLGDIRNQRVAEACYKRNGWIFLVSDFESLVAGVPKASKNKFEAKIRDFAKDRSSDGFVFVTRDSELTLTGFKPIKVLSAK